VAPTGTSRALLARGQTVESALDETNPRFQGRGWLALTRILAALAIVLIAAHIVLPQGFTVGGLLGLAMAPLWIPTIGRYRYGPTLLILIVVAMVAEVWLTAFTSADHSSTSTLLITGLAVMVEIAVGIGIMLWSRRFLLPWQIAVIFGIGLLAGIDPSAGLSASNPWRFGYAIPFTVIAFGLASITARRWVQLLVVLVFTAIATVANGRSEFAILLLTAILLLWQIPRKRKVTRGAALRVLATLGVVAVVVYNLGESLAVNGYLGLAAQQRTVAQIDSAGSLILGGRPELAATIALMRYRPFGFGAGIQPSLADILTAKTGMASINYNPNSNYVDTFMFGNGIELHSMIGDVWAAAGLAGIVLIAFIVFLAARGLGHHVAHGTASAVMIFAGIKTAWNVAFSPLGTSIPLLILFLGLVLLLTTQERTLFVRGRNVL
jgi:hypothetical protein